MDPGLSDVFARYAARSPLRRGRTRSTSATAATCQIPGYAFAPVFSIWTTIEECLNPPVVWDADSGGWITTEPFSAPEGFPFPEGIGPMECVNVEHEEVLLVPRWLPDVRRVTFKYALGEDFIDKLKTIHALGMDRTDKVTRQGGRGRSARRAGRHHPRPDHPRRPDGGAGHRRDLGHRPQGRARRARSSSTRGPTRRRPGSRYGVQVVGWQTGFNPVVAMELLDSGAWSGSGRPRARGI